MIRSISNKIISFWTNEVAALQLFHVMRQAAILLVAIALPRLVQRQEIGSYEQLFYLNYLLSFAWTTGLIQSFLALFRKEDPSRQRQFYFIAFISFTAIALIVCLPIWATQDWVVPLLTGKSTIPHFSLFLVYIGLTIPSLLVENYYLLEKQAKFIISYGVLSSLGFVIAVLWPFWQGAGLGLVVSSLVLLALFKYLWLASFIWSKAKMQWDQVLFRKWLVTAFPLILYALIGAINVSLESFLVGQWYEGDEEIFAIFRYGARELPFVAALSAALGAAILPIISEQQENGLVELKRRSGRLLHLIFPATILLMLTSSWWFPLVFSNAFAESIPIFNTFLLVVISRLLFARPVIIAIGGQAALPWFVGAELILKLIFCFTFFHFFGLVGLALATVLAYLLEALALAFWLQWRHNIRFKEYTQINWWLFYSGLLILVYFSTIFGQF